MGFGGWRLWFVLERCFPFCLSPCWEDDLEVLGNIKEKDEIVFQNRQDRLYRSGLNQGLEIWNRYLVQIE